MRHEKLSPSGMKTWANCSGSPQLIEALDLPPEDMAEKPAALQGTVAHYIVERCFLEGISTDQFIKRNVTTAEGYSYYADSDLIAAVNMYLSYVRGSKSLFSDFEIERFYSLERLDVPGLGGGTCDFIAFDTDRKALEVVDFKNGVRNVISPRQNWQLMQYALGFCLSRLQDTPDSKSLPKPEELDELEPWDIRLTIVQPRGLQDEKITHWDTSFSDMWSWAEDFLIPRAQETKSPDARLTMSPEACQWCRAKPACPEYQKLMNPLLQLIGAA